MVLSVPSGGVGKVKRSDSVGYSIVTVSECFDAHVCRTSRDNHASCARLSAPVSVSAPVHGSLSLWN